MKITASFRTVIFNYISIVVIGSLCLPLCFALLIPEKKTHTAYILPFTFRHTQARKEHKPLPGRNPLCSPSERMLPASVYICVWVSSSVCTKLSHALCLFSLWACQCVCVWRDGAGHPNICVFSLWRGVCECFSCGILWLYKANVLPSILLISL